MINRNSIRTRLFFISGIALLLLMEFAAFVNAAELGHYAPALLNIRDPLQPPPGSYYIQYHMFYQSDTFKDKNGDSVDSITIGPVTIDVDADVDSFMIVPAFVHVTDRKVLGANYGFLLAQPLGNTSFQATLEVQTIPGLGRKVDESNFGLGDTYVRPVWLGWNFGQTDINAAYGLYIPVGKYDAGAPDNVGLGMWTHEFMVSGAYYLDEQRGTALTLAGFYEIHHNKKDIDLRPGSHFTLNYGVSQYLPLSETFLSELGVAGYGQWQVTEDKGSDAVNTDVKDRVYGLGLQDGLTYFPWNGTLSLKWIHEFKAEDRFEGDFLTITASLAF